MTKESKDLASNHEINSGSIILLFDETDAKIARSWRHVDHSGKGLDGLDPTAPHALDARH